MTNHMEKLLGVPIGSHKIIPGTPEHLEKSGQQIVYFSDDGTRDFPPQFHRLTKEAIPRPRYAKNGGATSQGCLLWLPDGTLFHPIGYRGDTEGWQKDIESAAQKLGLCLAHIEGDRFIVSDGRSFLLSECKAEFD